MKESVHIFRTIEALSAYLAHDLIGRINAKPKEQSFSMALPGGSTPRAVFGHLAHDFSEQIQWGSVLLFWGDERCVPPDSDESNFRMARESLLDLIKIPAKNIFRIKGENEPIREAKRYERAVRKHIPSKGPLPAYDLFLLGLGDDGHTASIFPDNLRLLKSPHLFEVAEHPQSGQQRITATGNLINQAQKVAFLVTGEGKSEMVARIIEKKDGWEKLPASYIIPTGGERVWVLDDQAASKLRLDHFPQKTIH